MGSIYRRGKTFWIQYYKNGKAYQETSRSRKKMVANELLKKREGEISQGKVPGIHFDRVTFDELAEGFITDYKINQRKSITRAERSIKRLKEEFEGFKVPNITTPAIQNYIRKRMQRTCKSCKEKFDPQDNCPFCGSKKMESGAENATINRELAALKRTLNLGAKQTPPMVDRVPYIPMLKENNIRKGFFEHGNFLAIIDNLPDYLKGFVTFAYQVGWRLTEISCLTWNQVDRDQGIVRLEVGDTKNDEGRTIYLNDELKEVFQAQWEARKTAKKLLPYVFLNRAGDNRIKQFNKAWKKACEDARIGKMYFHDFRRTAIRNMVRAGIPEQVAMMISGHKTRSIFERYNIVNDADLKLASHRQAEYLNSQTTAKTATVDQIHEKRG